jgi:hypothetical protein
MKKFILCLLFFSNFAEAQLALRNTLHAELQSQWQLSAQYSLGSDFLDPVEPRMYDHQVSFNGVYNLNNRWRAGLLMDVNYFTLDNQIAETQKGYGRAQPSLNAFTTYRLATPFFDNHNVGASYFLPLDSFSREEGYNGILALNTTIVKGLWRPYVNWIQNFRGTYQFNSFDKSALGLPNRIYSVSTSPMININVTERVSLLLAFGIRWGEFSDGNSDYSYNNSQTLSYSLKKTSFYVRHTNGGYTEDGRVYLWFIDKNRKYIDAGVSYDF